MTKNANPLFLIRFGNHAKKIRLGKKITQAKIAELCRFDVSVISRIERGKVNTSIGTAKLLADALEIELKELFDFT